MKNDVTSFMFYMWNAWSQKECDLVFKEDGNYMWNKWQDCRCGNISEFYSLLDTENRDKLVSRALILYNGYEKKKIY